MLSRVNNASAEHAGEQEKVSVVFIISEHNIRNIKIRTEEAANVTVRPRQQEPL